ncbi:hypothetical protein MsAg5_02390 [Methanosarcinaceae archaeon Ag5]|uniref:CRISPR-associated protein n=1 Tax=Methanolapillus africanus TaxID=3028297 RepID=A0AAE4MIC4_9EURY|nr:hypothetical protein [Methanosarcinaceae archaeon Ag5]
MTGMSEQYSNISKIYLLNVGISKEHIEKAIMSLNIENVILFSSVQMKEDTISYAGHLKETGVNVLDMVFVDPFTETSVNEMIQSMLRIVDEYPSDDIEIIAGLTGGTNLMAISLGIVAFIKGLRCNYVLNKDADFIIPIDTFEKLSPEMTLKDVEFYFKEGF